MARKSKDVILRERLSSISSCPFDILEFAPEDTVFSLLPSCESGDVEATVRLCRLISDTCGERRSESLEYLLELGIGWNLRECAELALGYIARVGQTPTELARRSLLLIGGAPSGDALRVYAKLALAERELSEEGITILSTREYAGVPLCILPRDDGRISTLAELAGVPSVTSLPTFGGEGSVGGDRLGLTEFVRNLTTFTDPVWQDFWLQCAYEYASGYSGGVGDFASLTLEVIASRDYPERHSLYVYAAATLATPSERESVERLRRRCEFEGFDCEKLDTGATLREAVYLDSPREIAAAQERSGLGGVIRHTRNRFLLTHELSGHGKRTKTHCWELTMSIESDVLPTLTDARIEEVRYTPIRNGVELEHDPAICQLLCRAEIVFKDTRHPFILDLITDLSYVSATKCQTLSIECCELWRSGKFLTARCRIYLK